MNKYLLFVLIFSFGTTAYAQSKTLRECVDLAWERNINVKQTELNKWNSDIDLYQAKASRYPNLNAGSSLNLSGRSVDPTNNQFASSSFFTNNYNLSSNVLLYRGGQVINTIKRARQSRQSSEYQIDGIKQDIALQVANSYMNVLFSQENLGIAEKRIEVTREQLKQIELLIERGLRPKNAVYELRATLAADEQNVVSAEGNLDQAFLQLQQLMNIDPNERFDLVIPEIAVEALTDPFGLDPKTIYDKSWTNQPDYKNAMIQSEIAETDKRIAEAGLKPTIGFGGSVGTNYSSLGRKADGSETIVVDRTLVINDIEQTVGLVQEIPRFVDQPYFEQVSNNVTYGYGLSLQVPIYNNKNTKAQIERAELNKKNTQYGMELAENLFRNEIQQVLLQARNAKKQYEASLKSVEASEKALENIKTSYEAGASNLYDLTFATNAYDTALIQRALAKYDYIFKAMVIDFYLGRSINF